MLMLMMMMMMMIYMALDGDEDHDDQARSKAMLETAFQSDAFEHVPKRWPNRVPLLAVFVGLQDFSAQARCS